VPANASAHPFPLITILSIIRSVFFRGGWSHLLGNLLYLFPFGDNVGDRLGWIMYLALYLGSGFAAWALAARLPVCWVVTSSSSPACG
jgi:membrane associated rhomboid family serine protease